MSKEITELLESALKEHNDECLLCALKDTRINSVITLLKQQPIEGEFMKGELIAMQMNLGLGHRGEIILTTQERIDNNLEPLAKDIFSEASAKDFVHRWNSQPDLLEALSHIKDVLEAANKRPKEIAVNWKEFLTTFIETVLAKAKEK